MPIGLDILALHDASLTALGVTFDVVSAANGLAGRRLFAPRVLAAEGPHARLRGNVLAPAQPLAGARPRELVVVPGLGVTEAAKIDARLAAPDVAPACAWLRKAHAGGATVAASCSAVFVLGRAGLLDGRRCTTTWWLLPALKAQLPACETTTDSMVTEQDGVWTAGAAFAHIDLMLALVARLAGAGLASDVARHLVVEQRSSQARYVAPSFLAAQDPLAGRVEALVREGLPAAPSLAELAERVGVGQRTLARRLGAATGLSPMRLVQKIRLDTALHLLQTTRHPVDRIAQDVGFEDSSALYRLVVRHTGQTPSAFRQRVS